MNHGRKRALVVSGAVATLLGAGALVMPASARCPVNLICEPVEVASDGLGIIPDPTRTIVRDLYEQIVFPTELEPVYSTMNATLAPAEPTMYSLTTTIVEAENQVSAEVTPRIQTLVDEAGGPELYGSEDCDAKHDHKDHKNDTHCEK